jgi:acyl phosphate:glycerol-3-phosphate acyltransferase
MILPNVLFPFFAYGVGCFNAGYYLVRWKTGTDIRSIGSGSTGATNVGRLAGWKGFAATAFLDLLKGAFVMWSAQEMRIGDLGVDCSLIAVVGGHIWPLQLGFRGGRGVNPAIGALLVVQPGLCAFSLVVFAASFLLTEDYVLNGLFAFCLMPVLAFLIGLPLLTVVTLLILVAMLLYSQRANIKEHIQTLRNQRLSSEKDGGG